MSQVVKTHNGHKIVLTENWTFDVPGMHDNIHNLPAPSLAECMSLLDDYDKQNSAANRRKLSLDLLDFHGEPIHVKGLHAIQFHVLTGDGKKHQGFYYPDRKWVREAFAKLKELETVRATYNGALALCEIQPPNDHGYIARESFDRSVEERVRQYQLRLEKFEKMAIKAVLKADKLTLETALATSKPQQTNRIRML